VRRGDVRVENVPREGLPSSCLHGGRYGWDDVDGGQREAVRVPQADGTLVALPVEQDNAPPAALRLYARTSTSSCPTSWRAGSSPAASSTGQERSLTCRTATAR
jgi:hypothetical protein